jgi:nicotinamidase-related amidase
MPITTIDPKTALIVIDLQKGITSLPTVHPIGEVIAKSGELVDAFRNRNLPVVLVNVDGIAPGRSEHSFNLKQLPEGWTELIPQLNKQAKDHLVTKKTWGAFKNTDLEEHLKKNEVTQVVIVGVATSAGVESTARQAHECGFNVTLAVDAMTDRDPDAHLNSVTRIFPKLGETGTTKEIIDLLQASKN